MPDKPSAEDIAEFKAIKDEFAKQKAEFDQQKTRNQGSSITLPLVIFVVGMGGLLLIAKKW